MSETDNDKPKLGMRQPLGLKRTVETGKVKQSFSHGRSNTVIVETKRRRVLGPQGGAPETAAPAPTPAPATAAPAAAPVAPSRPVPSNETAQERQARLLREAEEQRLAMQEEARRRADAERQQRAEDDRARAEERARAEAEAAAAAAAPAPEPTPAPAPASNPVAEAPVQAEAPAAPTISVQPRPFRPVERPVIPAPEPKAEEPAKESAVEAPAPAPAPTPAPAPVAAKPAPAPAPAPVVTTPPILGRDPSMPAPRRFSPVQRPEIPKPAPKPAAAPAPAATASTPSAPSNNAASAPSGGAPRSMPSGQPTPRNAPPGRPQQRDRKGDERRGGKLTVTRALNEDGARARSLAALKRAREKEKRGFGGPREPQIKQVRDVQVPEAITVQELANRMAEKGADLVKALFKMGMPVTMTQTIDQDTAELLVTEFGHNIVRVSDSDIDLALDTTEDAVESLRPRPPVVTIMGHVDHGKTSLLDALRGTDVVRGEAGGITQHIGAYQVTLKDKSKVTFLDTPGHEAFTQMRARGADVTDIVVLVVAADDGLMPQTIEAINHTKAAGKPMIVAINKIDKHDANAQRVRERLLEHDVQVEDMGGETQDVEVSALKKIGLDTLIEKIQLQAELLELTANPDRAAEGSVVEAKLDKGRGPVATVLVTRGTLKVGDVFVVGAESGKVRALVDDKGRQVKEAGPAMPVEVLGLSGVPQAGDLLQVVENEARAREVAEYRQSVLLQKRTTSAPASLESMFSALKANQAKEYPLVVKADTQGTVEAIVASINKIASDLIKARILHSGVGGITESDVTLAAASGAPIIGFNVRANAKAREIAERNKVALKYYDVIYDLIDEIRAGMAGELGPEAFETVVGRAEIREVFSAGKIGKAAGLLVTEGVIRKALKARITRNDVIIYQGEINSLRRFKDDVAEVRAGLECGVTFTQNFTDIKPGDYLETFEVELRERSL
ncbi:MULTISPECIES: translation initiation factor IF-2 [Sphingomonas]|uniref:Translation initiation factor IF-2 n=1 Tax=Sphingomonas zeae TaxID=1646122 RepID=A0A7Y6B723_9SPHN|nr:MULTISPECIES: translation initiation factor IF-2 [Sphingomonas]MBB4046515.1 translation initiation factor IF-2 [Sphingomonas zeae]MDK8184294.1 translation initiation factor IF-2 [Sphingomonas zeae]MDK8214617.1 translation initiation factor IF-2 [Sphingomonas sp. UMB7805-LC452B]NUU48626.1 translation initiation factor IF-2 [Sphingomonas zeae]